MASGHRAAGHLRPGEAAAQDQEAGEGQGALPVGGGMNWRARRPSELSISAPVPPAKRARRAANSEKLAENS
jgi:hypothetical protein